MMLRLELLGGFRAYTESGEASRLAKQPRRAALLAFLALERDATRGKAVSVLWPEADADRARHSLNQGIYSLRRIVGAEWIELRGDRCVVAPWVSTDVEDLERAATAGDQEAVLALYKGPLLAGMPVGVTADFDVWLAHRRSSLERLHRAARRQRLADLLTSGRERDALTCAEEWCRLEPLEDEAHHHYIRLLAETGQRGAAMEHFRSYTRLLEEQGLEPLDETLALVAQLRQGEVGTLPAAGELPLPVHGAPAMERAAEPSRRPWPALLDTRTGLNAILAAVFLVNLLETTVETWLSPHLPGVGVRRLELARAAHWLEGGYGFEHHELVGRAAVVGFSSAYFFLFPLLLVGVGGALARRSDIRPFRVFSLAVVANYLVCLPFFLFFTVPERWWFSESGAVLLSDLWSVHLIELIRPFSALDNSFPSMHVSLTALAVLASFRWRLRYRWCVLFLGCAVALSTVVLGIHWLPDVVAGAATGVIGLGLALRVDARVERALGDGTHLVLPPGTRSAASEPGVATGAGAVHG
jgi:DNA-binding SARP family transcriptional activator/membrane-associated phospholipid phosphatase